jgi:hypothetical protein
MTSMRYNYLTGATDKNHEGLRQGSYPVGRALTS